MLTLKDVTFSYSSKRELIRDFSMQVQPGNVYGLLGKNGAGKSTLIYLICGLLRPSSGKIDFKGMSPIERNPQFLEDIFLVPEEFTLPKVMLKEFVEVNAPFYPKFDYEKMRNYLNIFELNDDMHLGALSMGQKKKVLLSFAMATNTSLLILDEPTNGLDITAKRNFRQAITLCADDNKSVLISTHQINDVDKTLDHVIIMDYDGVLLNISLQNVASHLRFDFTRDAERAAKALLSLDQPGGMSIIEPLTDPDMETEVNLESLYEFTLNNPQMIRDILGK